MSKQRIASRPAKSLALLVRFGAATARVLGASPGTIAPPRRELRKPLVTPATFTSIPPGGGEIWAALYDAAMRPISVYAWSRRPKYFGDVPNILGKVPGALRGGVLTPRLDDRFLHFELPRGAAYLIFLRNQVVSLGKRTAPSGTAKALVGTGPYGAVQFRWELLGAYSLLGERPQVLKDPLPFPFPVDPDRRWIMMVKAMMELPGRWGERVPFVNRGRIVDENTILDNGDPSTHFNIVITGDGFKEDELGEFDRLAKNVVQGLKTTPPFSSVVDRLNIHLIYAASRVSGIPSAQEFVWVGADTYYGVRRSWPDPTLPVGFDPSPGYCGISDPGRVYEAAKNFAPADQIQLFIMLANCDTPGGSAFHDQRIAFVTTGNTQISDNYLVWTAEHESAHVIGDLGEEYISPLPWDKVTTFHNVIDREHRETAWWKQLADAGELRTDGRFKYVYDCPDGAAGAACSLVYNDPYLTAAADPGKLGLYWGAQFVDPEDDMEELLTTWNWWDSPWWDTRGNNFFRGRARCRMRLLEHDWGFCEVCAEEMTRIINNPSL